MGSEEHSEIETLKTELKELREGYQKRLMSEQAPLCKLLYNTLGKESFEEQYLNIRRKFMMDWTSSVAKQDLESGKENNIQGILDFLWEPLKELGVEFSYDVKEENYVQLKVTKCPFADWARETGIEKWMYYYHCMSDYPIVEGYNPNISFKRSKVLMLGDDCCDHCYFTQ